MEALNDVVRRRGAIARMGEFTIELDGQKVASVRADGMIVATPTGSTGYALAANGPIVLANVNAMVVTPICPHLLTIRPMVVQGDAAIHLKIEGVPDQMFLTVDGQEALLITVGDEVRCKRSQYNVRLIRVHEGGFFDVLRSKLKLGRAVFDGNRYLVRSDYAALRATENAPLLLDCREPVEYE